MCLLCHFHWVFSYIWFLLFNARWFFPRWMTFRGWVASRRSLVGWRRPISWVRTSYERRCITGSTWIKVTACLMVVWISWTLARKWMLSKPWRCWSWELSRILLRRRTSPCSRCFCERSDRRFYDVFWVYFVRYIFIANGQVKCVYRWHIILVQLFKLWPELDICACYVMFI